MSFFSFVKKIKTIWPKRAGKESYSLVFNIGSGSVSGGIIKFTEKAGVNITYYAEEKIPFQQEVSVPQHQELMKSSLTALASKIRSEGLQKISLLGKGSGKGQAVKLDRVFYVFSSPWSASQTKTIRVKEPKSFKVTEGYLNRLIDEQEKEFQTGISNSGKVIERKIIQVKTNGYTVNDIYDKTVKDLEISVFFTVVPEEILHIVDQAVSKVFNLKNIWCHSLSLAVFSDIRNLFPQKEDFIHLDVSEEITDISIIRDNVPVSVASIPFGRHHFVRELSANLKVSEEIADSMIKMHCARNNDQLAALKQAVAVEAVAKDWLTQVTAILASFKEKIYVPEFIFLVAGSDLAPFLKDKLAKQDLAVALLDYNNVKTAVVGGNLIFKLELMFLDNLYKI